MDFHQAVQAQTGNFRLAESQVLGVFNTAVPIGPYIVTCLAGMCDGINEG